MASQVIREVWMLASIVPSHNLLVSMYESGSGDTKTRAALLSTMHDLKCIRSKMIEVVFGKVIALDARIMRL